jgi:light-regulated signal transduction histidine kinase (bacteriophytochrome)
MASSASGVADGARKSALTNPMDVPDSQHGQTLSLIAHELRSPASIINGYLRMLQQRDADRLTDDQVRMITEAAKACGRVLQVAQELGELALLEDAAAQVRTGVPVFTLFDEARLMALGEHRQSVPAWSFDEAERTTIVHGDAGRLKRAFAALVASAVRENGGAQLECVGFVSEAAGNPQAVMAVGRAGLAARRTELLGDRAIFDRWRGGMGLLVPIACRIIETHGGEVWSPASMDPRAASVWTLPAAQRTDA